MYNAISACRSLYNVVKSNINLSGLPHLKDLIKTLSSSLPRCFDSRDHEGRFLVSINSNDGSNGGSSSVNGYYTTAEGKKYPLLGIVLDQKQERSQLEFHPKRLRARGCGGNLGPRMVREGPCTACVFDSVHFTGWDCGGLFGPDSYDTNPRSLRYCMGLRYPRSLLALSSLYHLR